MFVINLRGKTILEAKLRFQLQQVVGDVGWSWTIRALIYKQTKRNVVFVDKLLLFLKLLNIFLIKKLAINLYKIVQLGSRQLGLLYWQHTQFPLPIARDFPHHQLNEKIDSSSD